MRTLGLIAAVMGAAEGYGQCAGPLFPQEAVDPISPGTIAVGDLNGDGADDLAIRIHGDEVWISLSDGSGGFSSYEAPAGFSGPFEGGGGVSIADVNGDGLNDLLVTADDADTPTLGRVYVGLNQGDGTFLAIGYSPVGVRPSSPLCIDVDNDGALDLAVGLVDGLAIMLNDGSGLFSLAQTLDLPVYFQRVVGDLNEDGNIDLALIADGDTTLEIVTLLGAGDGTFSAGPDLILDEDTRRALTMGDFDEDGHLDLAVLRDTHTANGHHVEILFGQGDASFIAGDLQPTSSTPRDILAGDYDQDSHLDLAIFDKADTRGHVVIHFGAGDGTFTPDAAYPTDDDPYGVTQGDFNGDTALDLLAPSYGRRPIILLNEGDGAFATQRNSPVNGYTNTFDLGDVDADGNIDVVVGTRDANGKFAELGLYLNDGAGVFESAWSEQTGVDIEQVRVGNFNGDGFPDLAAIGEYAVLLVLIGTGDDGFFNDPVSHGYGSDVVHLQIGDLNGDDLDDLVVYLFRSREVAILLNPGDGDFSIVSSTFATANRPRALFDADGDGDLDLLLSPGYSTIAISLNDGAGGFSAPAAYNFGSPGTVDNLATGDVDGDGDQDVCIGTEDYDPDSDDITFYATIMLNEGDGTFASYSAEEMPDNNPWYLFLLEDFDRDGDLDLAIDAVRMTNYEDRHRIRIRLNAGDGTFTEDRYYLGGVGIWEARLADVTGDGFVDIITRDGKSEHWGTYNSVTVVPSLCADACVGDLDGDGDTDQADLGALLTAYGSDDGGDLNGDGFTDQADLGILLADYGC